MMKLTKRQIRGVQYAIRECGEGPPLLLLHGFTGSSEVFLPFFETWAPHFHLIAPDLLGHGQSDAPSLASRYSMAETTADLASLLDDIGVTAAHVLGYSMGGRIGLAFAMQAGHRALRLMLEGASPGLATEVERDTRQASDARLASEIEKKGVAEFVQMWEAIPLFQTQQQLPEMTLAHQRRIRLAGQASGYAGSLRGVGTGSQPSYWAELNRLSNKSLLVTGALDQKFTDMNAQMARMIPDCRHVIVADAGHSPHIEKPDLFSSLVLDFFTA